MIETGVNEVYDTLDTIDASLLAKAGVRLAGILELANLSSIIGNVLANGIVKECGGMFNRAGAHKFQDLRACGEGAEHVEIKVALEMNQPKGHVAKGKSGHYLTVRYVLADANGKYEFERGDVVWIWEIRLGHLEESDFSESNTPGDSGKTANVTKDALTEKLRLVYFDPRFCPYKKGVPFFLKNYGDPHERGKPAPLLGPA